jgi:thymidine kinase
MGKLKFYYGTMASGKSTLALQMHYNFGQIGHQGLLLTIGDRSGTAEVSSRIGIRAEARVVTPEMDIFQLIQEETRLRRHKLDYVVCDEVQFYSPEQIEQLGRAADVLDMDVYGCGLLTDFQTQLFPGSRRLVEKADELIRVQSEMPCWCGQLAVHNARIVAGEMVVEGEQVVIGDLTGAGVAAASYIVLCRQHYDMRRPFG